MKKSTTDIETAQNSPNPDLTNVRAVLCSTLAPARPPARTLVLACGP